MKRSAATIHALRQRDAMLLKSLKRRSKIRRGKSERVKAQVACHTVFDRLWLSTTAIMPRWMAYQYLAQVMGVPRERAHIKYLSADECDGLIERIKQDYPQLFGKKSY